MRSCFASISIDKNHTSLHLHAEKTHLICSARVPSTRARSYLVMYGVVVRCSLGTFLSADVSFLPVPGGGPFADTTCRPSAGPAVPLVRAASALSAAAAAAVAAS